ncbi:precorrin-4 C(11)-methyltransferase [Desulfosoma caldarium]|uniref:Cobalt-precorrin 4 C11-methyltransferase n=1 Tax=Desulfosoma caldarium TaxID=610254 RepID=A0A3N1UXG4_9BACT|nr:precorrin-4 C(11)-methyltransferase [Desulfosoma caldarium]ROQ93370.1 cobalt-precorrin 4 C11-methyltransferase [Desulfosoma caldarium]
MHRCGNAQGLPSKAPDERTEPCLVAFVGAGPGDPELITVKGRRRLGDADLVIYAGSLVPQDLLQMCKPGTTFMDSASMTLEETHDAIMNAVRRGLKVVRLHTGDPSLYGAVHEQMRLLDEAGVAYEVVPGVSAVFAAAAELRSQLTVPEVSQTLIVTRAAGKTPVPERESLERLAAHGATLAIYLSVHDIERVVRTLSAWYAAHTPVVVAYRVSWPDQILLRGTLDNIAEKVRHAGIRRHALILVGDVFQEVRPHVRSRLYDGSFAHGYRDARS